MFNHKGISTSESRNNRLQFFLVRSFRASFVIGNSGFAIIDRYKAVRVNLTMELPRFSIALLSLLMCAGFLSGQTPSGSETGIEGVIMIKPAQPGPARTGAPDSIPLADVAFGVANQKGEVTSFTTDHEGRFRTPLPPGHYKVSLKGRTRGVGRYGPFEVDVVAGKMTNVQWQCDSGLR